MRLRCLYHAGPRQGRDCGRQTPHEETSSGSACFAGFNVAHVCPGDGCCNRWARGVRERTHGAVFGSPTEFPLPCAGGVPTINNRTSCNINFRPKARAGVLGATARRWRLPLHCRVVWFPGGIRGGNIGSRLLPGVVVAAVAGVVYGAGRLWPVRIPRSGKLPNVRIRPTVSIAPCSP